MRPHVLAVDGHDAAGKTTLARGLALALGGRYVHPFSGTAGEAMLTAAEAGDAENAWRMGIDAIESVMASNADAGILVFDRHFLTVFTLVPESLHASWPFQAPTALCWADLATTQARLQRRSEAPLPAEWHARYLERYRSLAVRWRCPVIETHRHDQAESLALLVDWARRLVGPVF